MLRVGFQAIGQTLKIDFRSYSYTFLLFDIIHMLISLYKKGMQVK